MEKLIQLFPNRRNLHFCSSKKIGSLLLLLIFGVLKSYTQSLHFCGEMHKPPMLTEGIPADEIIYDRFGNTYSLDELRFLNKKGKKVNCNTADVFQLTFVGNFTTNEESTICAVFSYLSSVISNNSNVQIPITIQQQQLDPGVLGVASDFYIGDCGLVNSNLLRAIRTGVTGMPEGVPAGLIRITPQPTLSTEWYTLADEQAMIPLSTSYFDLYSVVLHEAMHMLGFASLIGENGNSIGGNNIFSYWDTYLSAGPSNAPLIIPDTEGACCGAYKFNQTVFPDMPAALGGGCSGNIQFRINGSDIAPVNAVSANDPSVNTAGINSRLSHLAIPCASGGAAYVMNAEIAAGEARRAITGAELEMLCALGYPVASCATPCLLGAYDDSDPLYTITLSGVGATTTVSIPFNELLNNDIHPGINSISIELCGSDPQIFVTELSTEFLVELIPGNFSPGLYSFCYSISCNGVCDEASVEILVREDILAANCSNNTCNLTCYANFDEFIAGTSLFDVQLELLASSVQSQAGNNWYNTCDIQLNVNEQDSRIASWFLCDGQGHREFPRFPLTSSLPTDCGTTIRFKAAASFVDGCANLTIPALEVYGLSGPACGLIVDPANQPDIFTICNGVQAQRLGAVNVFLDPDASGTMDPDDIVNLDLVQYEINIPVNSSFDIQQLIFYGNQGYRYYFDDLEVYSDCTPTVQVTPTILEQCVDGEARVSYEVCVINTVDNQQIDIGFVVNVPPVPGVSLVPGGGFNTLGEANVLLTGSSTSAAVCTTLTLTLATASTVLSGTEVPLSLAVSTQNACTDLGPTNGDLLLVLQDCDPDPVTCHCPAGANTYVFGTSTSSVSYASTGGLPPDQNAIANVCFEVNGRLYWDLDVTLSNAHFIMNEGAEIVVPNGYGFYLNGSNLLEGCEHLWRGITIEGGAWFSANNSTIKDAWQAVRPQAYANVALFDNIFDANYVGVYVLSSQPVYNWGITGNDFICTQPLLAPFDGLSPAPPPITHAAFMLFNVPGTFVVGANNLMDGISNGLIAFRSGFSMEQCTIKNLVQNANSTLNQHGVWAYNCFVADVRYNTFEQVGVGIFANNVNLNAEFNTITGIPAASPIPGHAGIRYQNGANRTIRIRDNDILSAWNSGIRVNNCLKPALLRVKRNTVSLFPKDIDGAAIELQTCSSGFISDNEVQYNDPDEAWTALGLQNCSDMTVYNNSSNGLGITNAGGAGNNFIANTISSQSSFATDGFWVQNSIDRYCSNTTDGQLDGNGMRFVGACSPSIVSCNTIGNAQTGLRIAQFGATTSSIGAQINRGNTWDGTYTNFGAYHESGVPFIIFKSQFSMPQAEIPSWSTGAGMAVPWFQNSQGGGTINCNFACPVPADTDENPVGGGGDGGLSGLGTPGSDDAGIARNEFSGDGISWMSRWRLYERLLDYPDMPLENDVQAFKTQAQGETLGQLHAMSRQTTRLQHGEDWIGQAFASLQKDLQAISAQLQQTLKDGPLKGADAWRIELRSLYADLRLGATIYYRYEDWMAQQRQAGAASLLVTLNATQPSAQAAINVKSLQQLQLSNDFFLSDAVDLQALSVVKGIADQCPFEGGFAVYEARGIYGRYHPSQRWNDEVSCALGITPPDKRSAQAAANSAAGLRVSPNPANATVYFQTEQPFGTDARLEILGSTGELWHSVSLEAQSNLYLLPSAVWPAGIYHYRLRRADGAPLSGKFLILH